MPVILATQEAGIKRIMVLIQPGQIVHETLSQNYPTLNRLEVYLPSKCKALRSSSRTTKKKKKRKKS
jgi:hypothetical protein